MQWQKRVAQDKLDQLCYSQFLDSQSMKHDCYDLKQCLYDWEKKAVGLKVHLKQSSYDEAMQEDYQCMATRITASFHQRVRGTYQVNAHPGHGETASEH